MPRSEGLIGLSHYTKHRAEFPRPCGSKTIGFPGALLVPTFSLKAARGPWSGSERSSAGTMNEMGQDTAASCFFPSPATTMEDSCPSIRLQRHGEIPAENDVLYSLGTLLISLFRWWLFVPFCPNLVPLLATFLPFVPSVLVLVPFPPSVVPPARLTSPPPYLLVPLRLPPGLHRLAIDRVVAARPRWRSTRRRSAVQGQATGCCAEGQILRQL